MKALWRLMPNFLDFRFSFEKAPFAITKLRKTPFPLAVPCCKVLKSLISKGQHPILPTFHGPQNRI